MLQLCCTKNVIKQFGIPPESLAVASPTDAALGNWYVNLVTIERRKTLICMSERTLLSFLLFGIKKSSKHSLAELFIAGLVQLLEMEGFTEAQIHRAVGAAGVLEYCATSNRTVLGNLNDLQQRYRESILYNGGFSGCNLWELMRRMNRMPQRNIGWAYSIDCAREAVGG